MGYHFVRLFTFGLLVQGIYSWNTRGIFSNCNIQECDTIVPRDLLEEEGIPFPNEAELKEICPTIMRYMFCVFQKIESCEGMDFNRIDEMSNNETVAKSLRIVEGVSNLLVEVCREDTELHKGYVDNIDCFRDLMQEFDPSCLHTAVYKLSIQLSSKDQEEIDQKCIVMSITLACLTGQVKQQCGESAGKTMIELLRRIKYLGISKCTEVESAKLRGHISDMFELTDEDDANFFRDIFAVLKR